jgi:predicted metal-binding membrane protein
VINAFRTPADHRWYQLTLGLLVLAAWAALAVWDASPYAGLLDHRGAADSALAAPLRAVLFVAGWTLMTVAMMLPSSLPLVNLFRAITQRRPDRGRLLLLLLLGYLGVWAYFGLFAYFGDGALHAAVDGQPLLRDQAGRIGAALLLLAGLYQFMPLKQVCLEKCRSPRLFLLQHWSGRRPAWDALRLGARHGLFCLGCCWTLMLLMFAVGGANLGWMLALGSLMAAERTTRWGRRLTHPLGAVLAGWAALYLVGLFPFPASG